jgi:hypothetical protein
MFSGLVFLALLTACGTSGPPENVAPLVVRALLAAGRDSQFVEIGRASTLEPAFVPPMVPESEASVVLNGPTGQWALIEVSAGRYACDCQVIPGARYTVDARTQSGELAHGVTHVPAPLEVSPAESLVIGAHSFVEFSWRAVTSPGQYGIYRREMDSPLRPSFVLYTPDTTHRVQPFGSCAAACCAGKMYMVVAFSPSILTERGFPMPPGLSDTLVGALGVVGSATADSAIFHLDGAGQC